MSQKARWSRRMSQMAHAHDQRSQGAMTTETLYARRGAQSITQTPQSAVLMFQIPPDLVVKFQAIDIVEII
jgi:hypothetical protein